jgi:ATP-dependent HslUV protease ATP-binding subunit HslU
MTAIPVNPSVALDPTALTPRQIVAELDKYIVGQAKAKRSVAIALRNRYRRARAREDLRDEITPKNILMIGPTGVGKTEIARRLAGLVGAPFVKVEATKYTEVGYVGRDVESMVRDLVEASVRTVTDERREEVRELARHQAVERLIDVLNPETRPPSHGQGNPFTATLGSIFGNNYNPQSQQPQQQQQYQPPPSNTVSPEALRVREQTRSEIERGFYDVRLIEIEVEESASLPIGMIGGMDQGGGGADIGEMLGGILPKRRTKKRVTVAEARRIFEAEEAQKLIDMDAVKREALRRAAEDGIIFIDEIDKVAGQGTRGGPDVSREGVQRDILPIVEGSTVNTKYGAVKTDHVLFIAAGAFHMSKPSDLIPELQGRFPIRVELDSLTAEDFKTILTQPKNALVEQYKALLATENVTLDFRPDGIEQIATFAMRVNETSENIGARRLHTVLERLLEDVSFSAPEETGTYVVDAGYVRDRLADIVGNADLSGYIL